MSPASPSEPTRRLRLPVPVGATTTVRGWHAVRRMAKSWAIGACVRPDGQRRPGYRGLCRAGARARSPAITSTRPRAEYSLSKPGRPPASSLHLCAASRTETAATVPATAPSTNKKVMPAPVSPLLPSLLFFFWQVLRNLLSSSSSIYSQPIRLTFFSLEKEGEKKYK